MRLSIAVPPDGFGQNCLKQPWHTLQKIMQGQRQIALYPLRSINHVATWISHDDSDCPNGKYAAWQVKRFRAMSLSRTTTTSSAASCVPFWRRSTFNVLQAVDGIEVIDYATRTRADLVILDYKMPRLDGFATCAEIRCLPAYRDVPVIILTAFNDDDTRAAAQQAGATIFLTKPFKPIDLMQAIAVALGAPQANDGSAHATTERTPFVWKRRQDPPPLDSAQPELSEGRRILNIFRR